jgi:hypothetical protein
MHLWKDWSRTEMLAVMCNNGTESRTIVVIVVVVDEDDDDHCK